MSLKELAAKLYPAFIKNFSASERCRLFLSASSMRERATISHAVGDAPEKTWNAALDFLKDALDKKGGIKPVILRADWIVSSEKLTWSDCLARIQSARRNNFRYGIAFDKDWRVAFTEQELNANLILYDESKQFQIDKAQDYCRKRFDCDFPKISETDTVEIFETAGVFIQDGMSEPLNIIGAEERSGQREIFLKTARAGGNYLARQCNKKGKFIYGINPCDDTPIAIYSSLGHFSTLFSMMEVYATYGKLGGMTLGNAISRGLEFAIKNFVRSRKFPDGQEAAYIVDNTQLKLGANGVALLALTKWSELQRTKKYIKLMNALARGIFSFQRNDGSFVHVLNAEDFTVKDEFRTPYYDSEAVFGMLRLYAATKEEILLESAERAFNYFIANNFWKNHDHWLARAIDEFTIHKPEEKYLELGIKNCLPYISTVNEQDPILPSLPELILATENFLSRMKSLPEMSKLSAQVDWEFFYEALKYRAEQMLDGYFYPEVAMYFQNPERIVGSFFIRDNAFRVRVDEVQHYLSGLIAYNDYLNENF